METIQEVLTVIATVILVLGWSVLIGYWGYLLAKRLGL